MTKDPYKYFRVEAAELLDNLTRGVLDLEKAPADHATVASLLRLAHTLKGASQVVKQQGIAQVAHTVEDLLGPYRAADTAVPKDRTHRVMQLLDEVGAKLTTLEPSAGGLTGAKLPPMADALETVRVELQEMDQLLASLSEASVDLAAIQEEAAVLRRTRQLAAWVDQQIHASTITPGRDGGREIQSIADELLNALSVAERRITGGVERAQRELRQARDRANRLRLLPAQTIFPSLARVAAESAAALGKQVQFETAGGDVRLDAQVLGLVRDALIQLVRNAVAHGFEKQETRTAAGKLASGRIDVQVRRAGNHVTFLCRDDGAGIDLAAIRRAAVKKGAIPESDAGTLGMKEALDLMFKGGLSTSPVTRISGRGIGLDLVRDAIARLKGDIQVETADGKGTSVLVSVPVSLTSVSVLLVELREMTAAIPLDSVRQVLSLTRAEIANTDGGDSMVCSGEAIPFVRLSEMLSSDGTRPNGAEYHAAVVLTCAAGKAGFGVRRVARTATLLVTSLPALTAADPVIAGASLDAEGNPLLVLDPDSLIVAARSRPTPQGHAAEIVRAPILVIDDSLTTRMVVQGLLESAGHRVECATSGEEALERARQQRYSLFLVDVEMPGMDGYQFISQARGDPLLREIPSIVLTSKNSQDDRRRGQQVGARAFIAKSEFNQGQFLETVRKLMG